MLGRFFLEKFIEKSFEYFHFFAILKATTVLKRTNIGHRLMDKNENKDVFL
jgi:hypothetical protein